MSALDSDYSRDARPSSSNDTAKDANVVFGAAVLAGPLARGGDEEGEGLLFGTVSTTVSRVLTDTNYGDSAGHGMMSSESDGDASGNGDNVTVETTYVVTHTETLGTSLSFYDYLGAVKPDVLKGHNDGELIGFFKFRRRFRPPSVVSLRETAVYHSLADYLAKSTTGASTKNSPNHTSPDGVLWSATSGASGAAGGQSAHAAPIFLLVTTSESDTGAIHNLDYACFRSNKSHGLCRIPLSIANIQATISDAAFTSLLPQSLLTSKSSAAFGKSVTTVPFLDYLSQHEHMVKESLTTLKTSAAALGKVQDDYGRLLAEVQNLRAKADKGKGVSAAAQG